MLEPYQNVTPHLNPDPPSLLGADHPPLRTTGTPVAGGGAAGPCVEHCRGFSSVENSKQLGHWVETRSGLGVDQDLPVPLFLLLLSSAAAKAETAAVAAAATAAASWSPGRLRSSRAAASAAGGLSECEEGAARSEISIVTQDAPGAGRERVREEEVPARPQPAVLGAPQPPRAAPGSASLSRPGSD